jgi:hypothetical protein
VVKVHTYLRLATGRIVSVTVILDTVLCLEFLQNAAFWKLDLFPSSGVSGKVLTLFGPLVRASLGDWTQFGRNSRQWSVFKVTGIVMIAPALDTFQLIIR